MRKMLSVLGCAIAVTFVAVAAQAAPAEGDLLAEFTTSAAIAAPLSMDQLSEIRGEGTQTFTFLFPRLQHDIDQTFSFDTTTIHIVGDATTGEISVTVDSPFLP